MIRPLRQRHRRIVCTLAVILPVGLVGSIAGRSRLPIVDSLSPGLSRKALDFRNVVWSRHDLWSGHEVTTTLRRDGNGSPAVEFMCRDLARPDVLVYWTASKHVGGKLPEDASLLGVLVDSVPLPLPPEVRGDGRLVLYSLADQEIVAVSTPLTF